MHDMERRQPNMRVAGRAPEGKSLRHKTMALAAAEEIRQRILGGVYGPGIQLKQEALAREFGMSRIPVREALLLLNREGLVSMLPHRGAVVADLTLAEVDELFSMRMLMEPWLLDRSVGKLTDADFAELYQIQDRYAESLTGNDIARWNQLNKLFHMTLYRHADSPRMLSLVGNLLNECDIHTRIQLLAIPEDRERAVAEHRTLLELCRAGRRSEAIAHLHAHLDHIRRVLLAMDLRRNRDHPGCGREETENPRHPHQALSRPQPREQEGLARQTNAVS